MGIMSISTLHTQLNAPLVGMGAAWMPGGGARAVLLPHTAFDSLALFGVPHYCP